jgi:hypothetical protein
MVHLAAGRYKVFAHRSLPLSKATTPHNFNKRLFHKKPSKNCPPGWEPVFDQTFVESLRVRNAILGGAGDILFVNENGA